LHRGESLELPPCTLYFPYILSQTDREIFFIPLVDTYVAFWWGNPSERDHLENLGGDGR